MLTNATITAIAPVQRASAAGKLVYAPAVTVSVPCGMSEVDDAHRRLLGATLGNATAVCDVDKDAAAAAGIAPDRAQRWTVALDGAAPQTYQVVVVRNRAGNLAHWRTFLEEVKA